MQVDLIEFMGSDLTVVNAARVSMAKESSYVEDPYNEVWMLKHEDENLIEYLAKHGHWTPFSHPQVTLRVKAPIFVARQLFKHKQGLTENEVSRRYVDSEPEFYVPKVWRKRAENVKQGSSDDEVEHGKHMIDFGMALHFSDRAYHSLLAAGVCPEQARMVLPQSMYTEWYWTGSLAAFARVCKLRLDPHAQAETREVAQKISRIMEDLYPSSWKALMA